MYQSFSLLSSSDAAPGDNFRNIADRANDIVAFTSAPFTLPEPTTWKCGVFRVPPVPAVKGRGGYSAYVRSSLLLAHQVRPLLMVSTSMPPDSVFS